MRLRDALTDWPVRCASRWTGRINGSGETRSNEVTGARSDAATRGGLVGNIGVAPNRAQYPLATPCRHDSGAVRPWIRFLRSRLSQASELWDVSRAVCCRDLGCDGTRCSGVELGVGTRCCSWGPKRHVTVITWRGVIAQEPVTR